MQSGLLFHCHSNKKPWAESMGTSGGSYVCMLGHKVLMKLFATGEVEIRSETEKTDTGGI